MSMLLHGSYLYQSCHIEPPLTRETVRLTAALGTFLSAHTLVNPNLDPKP